MRKRKSLYVILLILGLWLLVACGTSSHDTSAVNELLDAASSTTGTTAAVPTADTTAVSVAAVATANSQPHEVTAVTEVDSTQAVPITLSDSGITGGEGVTVDGRTVTITTAGTYTLSGSLTDGQIVVNTDDEEMVRLILNGVTLNNATGSPINIVKATETAVILADNSQNIISDAASYVFADPTADEPNAAIFSKSNLTISGNGTLTVNGNYNDGIASKDGLVIVGGTITVNATDDGIRGKDYLVVKAGTITVTAQGDGLKSDNEEDATLGYIAIETGIIQITAGGDAIQAQTDVLITSGEFNLTAGGGSQSVIADTASAKGIKGVVNVNIDGGTFTINTADDAIHSNSQVVINGGTFVITTGDDGVHADAALMINNGDIQIADSYEGIESAVITINDGQIHILASDDGVNVAGGNDGSGMNRGPGFGGGPGRPGAGGMASQETFTYSGSYYLYINGGYIVVDAAGDGVDVNGAIEMTDGVVLVNGPTEQMNGALDYDALFKMTGGFLVTAGSAGMAQAPGSVSTQSALLLNLNGTLSAGTLIHIQTSVGEDVLTFAPTKAYQSISFSSPELVNGTTYEVYYGGSATGTVQDGLYQDVVYTPGTQYTSFTVSDMVMQIR